MYKKTKLNQRENLRFQRLVNGNGKMAKYRRTKFIVDMLKDMRRKGIKYPLDEHIYTVDKHVPMIQDYLNKKWPNEYRLSVFGQRGRMRPMWKGANRAKQEIGLYLKNGHYSPIRNISKLFGAYYCMECESTFSDPILHRAKCVWNQNHEKMLFFFRQPNARDVVELVGDFHAQNSTITLMNAKNVIIFFAILNVLKGIWRNIFAINTKGIKFI